MQECHAELYGFAGSPQWSEKRKKGAGLVWGAVKLTGATGAAGCCGGKESAKERIKANS